MDWKTILAITVLLIVAYCAVTGVTQQWTNRVAPPLFDGGTTSNAGAIGSTQGRLAGLPAGSSARHVRYNCGNRRPRVNMNACTRNADGSRHCRIDCI